MAAPSEEEHRLEKRKLVAELLAKRWGQVKEKSKVQFSSTFYVLHGNFLSETAYYFVLAHFFTNEEPQNRNKRSK